MNEQNKRESGDLKFVKKHEEEMRGTYSALRLVGVGGETGKEQIWEESLLAQIKVMRPNGIKLAIGITMYQEAWNEFILTMQGVVQGILDLYYDQIPGSPDFLKWEQFKEQFLVMLIADGYNNIPSDFKQKADKLGFFKEQAVSDTFLKNVLNPDGKQTNQLMTMPEIREVLRVRMETEDDPAFDEEQIINNLLHTY